MLKRSELSAADLPDYPGIALTQMTLVTSSAQAEQARAALLAADAVGFDTESKPTFRKGEVSTGPHLIQLATDDHCWLFTIVPGSDGTVLRAVLESPVVLKVGLGLGNDRAALRARLDIALNPVLDLGEALRGDSHRGTVGAKVAVAHFFGQRLLKSKRIGTSNWASRQLNERQLLYAANDAHVAIRLYRAWLASGKAVG